MQQALSSPTASKLLVENPLAAPAESLDLSLDPGQEECLPKMQPDAGFSQDGLTVGSNQHSMPSPPHLDTDDAPMMCSPPFQDSPPSSFCSPPQTELPTAESPAEPSVQLQDTFQSQHPHQDPHQHQDSPQLPVSKWHIHPPTSRPAAHLQISVPVLQQQQPSATAVRVALNGDNSVSPQETHSSECHKRPPPAYFLSSAASLLAPATPPAELTAALLVERNLATLGAPRECETRQSSQQSSTKVVQQSFQQIQKTEQNTNNHFYQTAQTDYLPLNNI